MRLFIAIDIPDGLKEKISRLSNMLKKCDLDVNFVNPSNIHITLKFLGETSEENIDKIKSIITAASCSYKRFKLTTTEFGFFPSEKKPRVFFLATDNEEILKNIFLKLEEGLKGLGFAKENLFKSHLTIARLGSSKNITRLKDEIRDMRIKEEIEVCEIILFKSVLTPSGPVYEKLFCAQLN